MGIQWVLGDFFMINQWFKSAADRRVPLSLGFLMLVATTALCTTLSAGSAIAQAAGAQQQGQPAAARSFRISAQPLASALRLFAEQSGIQFSYATEDLQEVNTRGLNGSYSPDAGLDLLLRDTGIAWRYTAPGTVTLSAVAKPGGAVVLDTLRVTGTAQSRYESRTTDTMTRIPKDVIDIPRTIDIIPEQLLLDQQSREMEDVYRLSPNVVNVDGYGGTREDYLIRGFRRRDDIYRNGVRLKSSSRFDPATVDSIEVVKGPVADIGQMTPGGLVNIVTKKPEFDQQNTVSTGFDEHGQRRLTADTTGAILGSKNFAYRVTTAAEDSETFRNLDIERQFISSSLLWSGNSGASISLNHEYSHDDRPLDRGFVTQVTNGRRSIVSADPSTRFDQPDINKREAKYNLLELDTSFPISDAWSFENKLFFNREDSEDIRAEVTNVSTAGVLTRQVQGNRDRTTETRFARAQVVGEFDAMVPVKLASGLEYHEQSEKWINFSGATQVGGTVSDPSSFTVVDNSGSPTSLTSTDVNMKSYGPYAQVDFELADKLTFTTGLRYEYYENSYDRINLLTSAASGVDTGRDAKLTKSFGLVWKPQRDLSLYTSYADTFQSQNIYGGNAAVVVMAPEQGRQYEVGTKWSTLDNRLFLTAAVFEIRQDNVVETVNGTPQPVGGITSRGSEFSFVANPYKGFNIRGALGLLDAYIMSASASTNGQTPTNVPNVTGSLWASYEFQEASSSLKGLGFGAGLTHVGNRYGDNEHSFELGDYTLLDAGVWYYLPVSDKSRIRFDLGVKNITDEEYFTASGGTYRISVGTPRTFFGAVRVEF